MSTHSHLAVTRGGCVLCGGPCREPMKVGPIHDNYPFMNPEAIASTQPVEQAPEPRSRPRDGNRARHLVEDRAHHPGEDR